MNNNVIIIDDDSDFIKVFTNEARAKNIQVAPKNSLEGLKQLLPQYAHKYAAVVLDIKCLLDEGQVKEDSNFIGAALTYLDTNVAGFPRFILTGDETEFGGVKKYHSNEQMFLKTPDDQEKLFNELAICIRDAEPLRLRRENPEVFEIFDKKLLTQSKETTLLSILSNYHQADTTKFKGILGDIREVHEEIYKCLNLRNKTIIPDKFINGNGSPIFSGEFYRHLLGNPDPKKNYATSSPIFQDSTISHITKFIHSACSEYLHGTSNTNYAINHYVVKGLINSLMEIIIWSKQY